ncbi:metallophosphoesterase family protein [Planktothrix pseudagardhii]|uniref:Ser/Thr protein phosphatase family protein n=1 Tax=Planktothrix pseudagardhii TaxID=132604 RepID=A0A9W4CHE8_9CYAN|nr:metallophosphoesterase [Planktothrix pseudagardhii]CAD5934629.1 Ser/Thr protein phosphatase family protein [Planktothrix pseudagardhii]
MQFIFDPPIATKINKMKERVRWQDPLIMNQGIDQTSLVIDDGKNQDTEFSFLVIGDSGTGYKPNPSPQRKVAELLLENQENCRFIIHTGDVVYLVGSSEYYPDNFIHPYREFLVGGETPQKIPYDQMVFNLPFLPVLGNHDYYDLPWFYSLLAQLIWLPRHLLFSKFDFDIGWHGSFQGKAYAQAFLDYLATINPLQLQHHLDQHYTAKTNTGQCLRYQPGLFTRLPNRYYTFRYGGIDFFALDSNTFNAPEPLPNTLQGEDLRSQLQQRANTIELEKQQLMKELDILQGQPGKSDETVHDYLEKIEQLEEQKMDIQKQLNAPQDITIDFEQLNWLKQRLIESWHTSEVRGRVLYFHHPPYVTEATKWNQAQTIAVRNNLRYVLNEVSNTIGNLTENRPIVDLVLNGHAHCLEHLYTANTGFADSYIHWLICGGSGYSLRRQRPEGNQLMEFFETETGVKSRSIAESLLFVGRTGQGREKRRPYSGLRIDVLGGKSPKFRVKPLITERFKSRWKTQEQNAFIL